MALNLTNFVRTTLRAPLTPDELVLQLAPGTGSRFDIPVGDYFFITLRDRLHSEVVRYVSTGSVQDDNIVVTRAQDGTAAKAFPVGTCVELSLNVQQLKDLVTQMFVTLQAVTCPRPIVVQVNGVPTTEPADCVVFAVNTATSPWSVYFWTGTVWQELGDGDTIQNTSYVGVLPIQVDESLRRISLALGPGLTIQNNQLVVDLGGELGIGASGQLVVRSLIGSTVYFSTQVPPAGWLIANGAAISRTSYASLFAVIGTIYGAGDGSTTFNIPDMRGLFVRGLDIGRGVDPGRALGAFQGDAMRDHIHYRNATLENEQASIALSSIGGGGGGLIGGQGIQLSNVVGPVVQNIPIATENRPVNISLLPCIKY